MMHLFIFLQQNGFKSNIVLDSVKKEKLSSTQSYIK